MGKSLRSDPKAHQLVKGILGAASHKAQSGGNPQESAEIDEGSSALPERTASLMQLNRKQTSFPISSGEVVQLLNDTNETFKAMAREVDRAQHHVNVLYFQTSWDQSTDPLYKALVRACARGVTVRLLVDHHGVRTIPGWRDFCRVLDESGLQSIQGANSTARPTEPPQTPTD